MTEPIYEADPNCKQCKGTGSILFDSEAGREYDDCECLKQIDCEKNLLFKAKTMHAAMSANIAKGDPESGNIKGLTEVSSIISSLITTIESQKEEIVGLELSKEIEIEHHADSCFAYQAEIESLKAITELKNAEIETLKDHLGDIHYGLTCLDPVLEMPEKGFVRNQYNKLLDVCKEFRHE